jgi:hypothetical protein
MSIPDGEKNGGSLKRFDVSAASGRHFRFDLQSGFRENLSFCLMAKSPGHCYFEGDSHEKYSHKSFPAEESRAEHFPTVIRPTFLHRNDGVGDVDGTGRARVGRWPN